MAAWKDLERRVAKYFKTQRRKRGADFSQSDVEIIADIDTWLGESRITPTGYIIAECKYRSSGLGIVDSFLKIRNNDKHTLGFLGEDCIVTSLTSFNEIFQCIIDPCNRTGILVDKLHEYEIVTIKERCPGYVNEWMDQARSYVHKPTVHGSGNNCIIPILCLAKARRQGIYAVFCVSDVQTFHKAKNSTCIDNYE